MNTEMVEKIYSTGALRRYHTEDRSLEQEIGQHCWGVATLLALYNPESSAALLKCALLHDAGERYGPGDVSFIAKRDNPDLRDMLHVVESKAMERLGLRGIEGQLDSREYRWFKWADMAEAMLHAKQLYDNRGYPCAKKVMQEASSHLFANFMGLSDEVDEFNTKMHEAAHA